MGLGTSSFFSYLNTMRGFACRFRLRSVFQPSETIRCAMFSIARFALPRKRLGRSTHTFRERKLVPGRVSCVVAGACIGRAWDVCMSQLLL